MNKLAMMISAILSTSAMAEPVIEQYDSVAFNWGTMRWEFAGEAAVSETQGDDAFKVAERHAWQDGLRTIQQAVTELQQKQLGSPKERAIEIAKEATRSTYSRNTTYFSSGLVRVELENSLVAARSPQDIGLSDTVAASAVNSSLVIKLDKKTSPMALYRVVNESGDVLFDSASVNNEYFRKNLMGRWFKRQSGRIYEKYAGASPVVINAAVNGTDLLVKDAEWRESMKANEALLSKAQILLILP